MSDEAPTKPTLETIARQIEVLSSELREFRAEVNQRFAEVNQRFSAVEHQLAQMDIRLDTIEGFAHQTRSETLTLRAYLKDAIIRSESTGATTGLARNVPAPTEGREQDEKRG